MEGDDWTVKTLREHFQRQLDDLRKMLDERYETQTKAVDAAFQAQQKAVQTAFAAADRAEQTAVETSEKAVAKAESTFLRAASWEEWRRDTYGQRMAEFDRNMTDNRVAIEAIKVETDRRYRTSVNLALAAFLSFAGGGVLLVLQLVAK